MARAHSLVRRLLGGALGCTSVICTDKTATLTENVIHVTRLWLQTVARGDRPGIFARGTILEKGRDSADRDPALRRLLEIAASATTRSWRPTTAGTSRVHQRKAHFSRSPAKAVAGVAAWASLERLHEVGSGLRSPAHGDRCAGVSAGLAARKGLPEALLALCYHILDPTVRDHSGRRRKRLLARAHGSESAVTGYWRSPSAPGIRPGAGGRRRTDLGTPDGLEHPARAGVRSHRPTARRRNADRDDHGRPEGLDGRGARLKIAGPADLCVNSGGLAQLVRERRSED